MNQAMQDLLAQIQKEKEATEKLADSDYERGRADGLLEAIKILM